MTEPRITENQEEMEELVHEFFYMQFEDIQNAGLDPNTVSFKGHKGIKSLEAALKFYWPDYKGNGGVLRELFDDNGVH